MQGRTWRNIGSEVADEIRSYLLAKGGTEVQVNNVHEEWRVRYSDSTFTFYRKGTIYSSPSTSDDSSVVETWNHIDLLAGSAFCPPTKDYLIGLDETGKGEVIGHTILAGVIIPKDAFRYLDLILGPADTKRRHSFAYWDEIFTKIDELRTAGLDFEIERIPPWDIDKYNVNKIMDITYQRMLSIFLRRCSMNQCRVVLDDYGVKYTLRRFLDFLELKGAEVVLTTKAEDSYLEAKVASLIAKRSREAMIKVINEKPEFIIDGLHVGTGAAGPGPTRNWLQRWHASGRDWPWFVKKSFRTVRDIEGKKESPVKRIPPINERLLSKSFVDEFNKGKLSTESLSLVCPSCGHELTSATFAVFDRGQHKVSELRCPNHDCGKPIPNASMTLRYICGYVIPDSSAIRRRVISRDLGGSRFFENFTMVLVPIVRRECDGPPGCKKELDELRRYDSMGRIKLESPGRVEDIPNDLSNQMRDERIIEACLKWNSMLLCADKPMSATARGKNVFTIFV